MSDADIRLTPDEMREVFGEADPLQHHDEAEQRWGSTDSWKESKRRTSAYSKEDWVAIQAEGDRAVELMLEAFRAGEPADSDAAVAGARAHRTHIDRWFYPCSAQMQCGLADMYLADERFRRFYDDRAEGLAQYVHDAIYSAALREG